MRKLTKNLLTPKFWGVLGVSYTVALTAVSLAKLSGLEKVNFSYADKVFHALSYFGLTLIWAVHYFSLSKYSSLTNRSTGIICCCTFSFGIIIEILQLALTEYRSFDLYDMLANTFGVVLAGLLISAVKPYLNQWKKEL